MTGQAAKVLRLSANDATFVLLQVERGARWEAKELACLRREGKVVVCGRVLKTANRTLIFKILRQKGSLKAGEAVELVAVKKGGALEKRMAKPSAVAAGKSAAAAGRRPAATMDDNFVRVDREPILNLSLGAEATFDFVAPTLEVVVGLPHNMAVGLRGSFSAVSDQGTSVKALSLFAVYEYYTRDRFEEFSIDGGVGFYSVSASGDNPDESKIIPALRAMARFRWSLASNFNFGIGGGAQLLFGPELVTVETPLRTILPVVAVDVGFAF
jgi:hypothetical protein